MGLARGSTGHTLKALSVALPFSHPPGRSFSTTELQLVRAHHAPAALWLVPPAVPSSRSGSCAPPVKALRRLPGLGGKPRSSQGCSGPKLPLLSLGDAPSLLFTSSLATGSVLGPTDLRQPTRLRPVPIST